MCDAQLYELADTNHNGLIEKNELKSALLTLGFSHLGDAQVLFDTSILQKRSCVCSNVYMYVH